MSPGSRRSAPRLLGTAAALALCLAASGVHADDKVVDPKFEYGKAEKVKAPEWKAMAKVAVLFTSGNSRTGSGTLSGAISRKADMNKFALDAAFAYARSFVLSYGDQNGNGVIDPGELRRDDATTTNAWSTKLRYDRFFSENNAAYVAGLAAADQPGGKEFFGGAQLGYSRQLYMSKVHEVRIEAGYDFSHERYVTGSDPNSIHSLRLFAGYTLKVLEATGVNASLEMLSNLNTEHVPTADKKNEATAFKDTRLVGKVGLSTTLWKKLSIAAGVTLKFDNVPAPMGALKIPFATGYTPLAEKLDTITELGLIYTFL